MFLAGLCTGASVGLFISVLAHLPFNIIGSIFPIFLFLVPLISAYTVQQVSLKLGYGQQSLRYLIPVGFLTLLLPVLGPTFGGRGDLIEIPIITLMGAVGGAFWGIVVVLFSSLFIKIITLITPSFRKIFK